MPDQKTKGRSKLRYEYLKSQFPELTELSYKEARRLKGPIYEALRQELMEAACVKTEANFACLVARERSLYASGLISNRLFDDTDFLIEVIEKFRLAEQSSMLSERNGNMTTLRILYQTMQLLESKGSKFDWMLDHIYNIVMHCIEGIHHDSGVYNEIKMRLFYKYGKYLFWKGKNLDRAVKYLEKTHDLAKTENWQSDAKHIADEYSSMSESVAQLLARSCLLYSKQVLKNDAREALKLTTQSVAALYSIDTQNKTLLYKADLSKINMLIECGHYDYALRLSRQMQQNITKFAGSENKRLKCKLFLYKGHCFYYMNDFYNALESFYTGYSLSHKYQMTDLEAQLLVSIGRIFGRDQKQSRCAVRYLNLAKEIYVKKGDEYNKMMIVYLLAKLKVDAIFPVFLDMLRSPKFCDLFRLRQWKGYCKPFWKENEADGSVITSTTIQSKSGSRRLKSAKSLKSLKSSKVYNFAKTTVGHIDLSCVMKDEY